MSQQTQTRNHTQQTESQNAGSVTPFEGINEPGAYIANWSGHLLRVPEDGVASGRSPVINVVGTDPLTVTKISDNPYVPLTKARLVASNLDVNVNF